MKTSQPGGSKKQIAVSRTALRDQWQQGNTAQCLLCYQKGWSTLCEHPAHPNFVERSYTEWRDYCKKCMVRMSAIGCSVGCACNTGEWRTNNIITRQFQIIETLIDTTESRA